jgi:hypothetical protein
MTLFQEIIKIQLDKKEEINAFDPLYCYYNKYINLNKKVEKFKLLKEQYDCPYFMDDSRRVKLIDAFYNIQRTYHALNRFSRLYRLKRAKIVVDQDLCLNYINPVSMNVISIYDSSTNSIFYFTLRDLINIIHRSLTNSVCFFVEPIDIKNPYNNVPFTKGELYHIYFSIKKSLCVIPELFHLYFLTDFSLDQFALKYETNIRYKITRDYVYKSSYEILYPTVLLMIYHESPPKMWKGLHDEFPKDKLVKIMRPYLELYYLSCYCYQDTSLAYYSIAALKTRLRLFYRYNPKFGRKYIKINNKNGKIQKVVTFNDKHIPFLSQK